MSQTILERVGIKVGHYTNHKSLTGSTCFVAPEGAHIGIDIRGSNTGTFNTPAFDVKSACELAYAVLLTGGSTFGLQAALGVMQYLEEKGKGYRTRAGVVPAVTGAVIYDLAVGDPHVRPTIKDGYEAAVEAIKASANSLAQGNVGVGTGATVGKWFKGIPMKGGLGVGISEIGDYILVVAFAVTNAVGDVVNPKTGVFYSEGGKQSVVNAGVDAIPDGLTGLISTVPTNTTLAVVATNVSLRRSQLMKVAEQAHNGMARAIHPIHTNLDGDVIFALSSLSGERKKLLQVSDMTCVDLVSLAASDAMVKAINNSVMHAESIVGFPAYKALQR